MKDSKRYFDPETIKRISRLELRSKYIVEGLLSGMHRSPRFGQSVEFRQHREYSVGDELRHVDWKVWARQDRLYVKQFEDETNLNCQLLVDSSASMNYASGLFSKFEYAATLACCLAYLVLRQKDKVGCVSFNPESSRRVLLGNRKTQLKEIANVLDEVAFCTQTAIAEFLMEQASELDRNGLIVVICDVWTLQDGLERAFKMLRQRGHDVILMPIVDPDEVDFPFKGPTRFEGLELDGQLQINPEEIRNEYLALFQERVSSMRRVCLSNGCDFELIQTSQPFNVVLSKLLNRRLGTQRR